MVRVLASNVTVFVDDFERSIDFYKSIGLTLKRRWEDHYALMVTEGITVGLHPRVDDQIVPNPQVSIGFIVQDIDEAIAVLETAGVEFTRVDEKSGIYLKFNDPDGTFLYFTEPNWEF